MLARLRAIEHLLREPPVHLGGIAGRVVGEHGAPLHRGLREPDRLADLRVEDEVAEFSSRMSIASRECNVLLSYIVGRMPWI